MVSTGLGAAVELRRDDNGYVQLTGKRFQVPRYPSRSPWTLPRVSDELKMVHEQYVNVVFRLKASRPSKQALDILLNRILYVKGYTPEEPGRASERPHFIIA